MQDGILIIQTRPDCRIRLLALFFAVMKNKIKELRLEAGLTQQELAQKVGVRRETIVFLEMGKYNPSLKLAFQIAKVFDRKIEEIFYEEEEKDILDIKRYY